MFRSISNAISRTADVVAATATSAEKALDNVNHYVTENTKANNMITTTNAQRRVAKCYQELEEDLNADENLKSHFEKVQSEW